MKISLNWIFDHIKGELARVDVAQLVDKIICTTAEIEGWKKVSLNTDNLTLAEVVGVEASHVTVHSAERNKNYTLPARADALVGSFFMIVDGNNTQKWATTTVLGGTKDMLIPALDVEPSLRSGGWKSTIELSDYIVEIDNKSINSRPDLWGHRGLAREIAAILDLSLKSVDELMVKKDIMAHESSAQATAYNPFDIAIESPKLCTRFAALYVSSVIPRASQLHMVIRLSRLDSRSIDMLVDATNYVMLDLGQPMHAFDADTLQSKKITIACAQPKEKLLLLDGETVELTSEDVVIADGGKAVSLAGVMGGAQSGVSAHTKSLLLESATFDAATIRRTSARHKKRTEASMRFEKSLDPHQNIDALRRYLFLLDKANVTYQAGDRIVSLGVCPEQTRITVEHAFIEARLGIIIKPERVVAILEHIAFEVDQSVEHDNVVYTIAAPSFRAAKDVKIPEDIVEEIGRYIGYDALPRVMPALQLAPSDLHTTYTTRAIKKFLSYGLMMHELYGYSFFDESVLREIGWQPTDFVPVTNPISENHTRLVTTLQPHLLKAVADNSVHHTALRFYEWGRVWHKQGDDIIEQKSLSGIFFHTPSTSAGRAEEGMDFYTGKALLTRMFDTLHMNVTWAPYGDVEFSWVSSYQTAALMHEDKQIGIAGMVEDSTIPFLSPAGGVAFIFEINADYLLDYKRPEARFESLSKYPSVRRDVSMLISAAISTDALMDMIKGVDKRIENVMLLDFFTKSEWKDQKAMTFHVEMGDREKTLVADEVEEIWNKVIAKLQEHGAAIR